MSKLMILSGGMDSVTLLHEYRKEISLAVSFNYGQKHFKELQFASDHCNDLNIAHRVVDISSVMIGNFRSNLLQGQGDIPEGHYEDYIMRKTVVPFRNGIMISIAVGIAESEGLQKVALANHLGDHAIYPDCRFEFVSSMSLAVMEGTYGRIALISPYVWLHKRQIALRGKEIGIDYAKTWSCYKGGEFHCGKCGTCIERKEALEGFDTTKYFAE